MLSDSKQDMPGSSSGLGHRPLTAATGVRLPYRVPTGLGVDIWNIKIGRSKWRPFFMHKNADNLAYFDFLLQYVELDMKIKKCSSEYSKSGFYNFRTPASNFYKLLFLCI